MHGRRVGHLVDRESGRTNPQGTDEEEGERGPLSEAAARAAGVVRRDEGSCLFDFISILSTELYSLGRQVVEEVL